jgi:hypothetical protein
LGVSSGLDLLDYFSKTKPSDMTHQGFQRVNEDVGGIAMSAARLTGNLGASKAIQGITSGIDLIDLISEKGVNSNVDFYDTMRILDDVGGIAGSAVSFINPAVGAAISVGEQVATGLAKTIKAEIDAKPKNFEDFAYVALDSNGLGWMTKDVGEAWNQDIQPKIKGAVEKLHEVYELGDMNRWKENIQNYQKSNKQELEYEKAHGLNWKTATPNQRAQKFFFGEYDALRNTKIPDKLKN